MANWRSKLRPASFRGIKFEVTAGVEESGRRGQLHEYPNKDIPYFEDLGAKGKVYPVEGFVSGDDYLDKRDALKTAINTAGPGTLIHPTYGTLEVCCTSCSISETVGEGRMARFTLSFVEAGEQAFPNAVVDYKDQINALADETEQNATQNFLSRFDLTGKASAAVNSAASIASSFGSSAFDALSVVNTKIDGISAVRGTGLNAVDEITSVAEQMSSLSNNALELLKTPDAFAARVSNCFGAITSLISAKESTRQIKTISNLGVAAKVENINPDTVTGGQEIELLQQIDVLITNVGLSNQAKAISSIEFDNVNEAEEMLADFVAQVEEQELLNIPRDNSLLTSLKNLQAMLVKDISGTIRKLPEVRNITLLEHTPSVLVAYNLYGDIERADEIVARNKIKNPGFIPAHTNIEVLTR